MGSIVSGLQTAREVTKVLFSRIVLGKQAAEGESPVDEKENPSLIDTQVGRSTCNSV